MRSFRGICALLCIYQSEALQCVVTQTCLNSGSPSCLPHATNDPPKPMSGDNWTDVIGGGNCHSSKDCSDKGACNADGKCECANDGVTGGEHCELVRIQCPEYKDLACCTWQQNADLAENFKLLTSTFGKNAQGGCDACAANLMRLWCGLTCSPRQSEFLQLHSASPSTNTRPDPLAGGHLRTVLEMNVTLSAEMTCELYNSCKNTAIASVAEAMKSSLGFLNYQAQTGAIGHGEYYFLSFKEGRETPHAFNQEMLQCSNYSEVRNGAIKRRLPAQAQILPSIQDTSEIAQCPCGACKASCSSGGAGTADIKTVANPILLFSGFNIGAVCVAYAVCIVTTALIWWNRHCNK